MSQPATADDITLTPEDFKLAYVEPRRQTILLDKHIHVPRPRRSKSHRMKTILDGLRRKK